MHRWKHLDPRYIERKNGGPFSKPWKFDQKNEISPKIIENMGRRQNRPSTIQDASTSHGVPRPGDNTATLINANLHLFLN